MMQKDGKVVYKNKIFWDNTSETLYVSDYKTKDWDDFFFLFPEIVI